MRNRSVNTSVTATAATSTRISANLQECPPASGAEPGRSKSPISNKHNADRFVEDYSATCIRQETGPDVTFENLDAAVATELTSIVVVAWNMGWPRI